jgi:hypothetical protein
MMLRVRGEVFENFGDDFPFLHSLHFNVMDSAELTEIVHIKVGSDGVRIETRDKLLNRPQVSARNRPFIQYNLNFPSLRRRWSDWRRGRRRSDEVTTHSPCRPLPLEPTLSTGFIRKRREMEDLLLDLVNLGKLGERRGGERDSREESEENLISWDGL